MVEAVANLLVEPESKSATAAMPALDHALHSVELLCREIDRPYCIMSERAFGSLERSFNFPDGVDAGKISATLTKGVLAITPPRNRGTKRQEKTIAIKAA